ncbi:unnamed protein product [Closterium sp. Yama58-4]|nr:unnamed protein product [Closterium sp. Yama58-4]
MADWRYDAGDRYGDRYAADRGRGAGTPPNSVKRRRDYEYDAPPPGSAMYGGIGGPPRGSGAPGYGAPGGWRDADPAGLRRGDLSSLAPPGLAPPGTLGLGGMPDDHLGPPPPGSGMRSLGGMDLAGPPMPRGPGGPPMPMPGGMGAPGVGPGGMPPMDMHPGDMPIPHDASPTLYIDNLPPDCSRREACHIFRPFIGFKEVRLVPKEVRRGGEPEKLILCFVDFADARCAATALEALQGYRFDENDYTSPNLRIDFARQGPRSHPRDDFRRDDRDFGRGGGAGGPPFRPRR